MELCFILESSVQVSILPRGTPSQSSASLRCLFEKALVFGQTGVLTVCLLFKVRVMCMVGGRGVTRNSVKGMLKCWQTCMPKLEGCLVLWKNDTHSLLVMG